MKHGRKDDFERNPYQSLILISDEEQQIHRWMCECGAISVRTWKYTEPIDAPRTSYNRHLTDYHHMPAIDPYTVVWPAVAIKGEVIG